MSLLLWVLFVDESMVYIVVVIVLSLVIIGLIAYIIALKRQMSATKTGIPP